MVLNFGLFGGNQNLTNISGVQFEQEAQNTKVIQWTCADAGNLETIYTVPAGKNLFIGSIIFCNTSGANSYTAFTANSVYVYRTTTPGQTSIKVDFPIPMLCTAGTVLKCGMYSVGSTFTLLGWEA